MLESCQRQSISALLQFQRYSSDSLSIGQILKTPHSLFKEIQKDEYSNEEQMFAIWLDFFFRNKFDKDVDILETEIISAIEKACSTTLNENERGFLNLSESSPLKCLELFPFLRDTNFNRHIDTCPTLMDMFSLSKKRSADWFMIGLLLGIEHNFLKSLKRGSEDNKCNLEECLCEWMSKRTTHPKKASIDLVMKTLMEWNI